MQLTYRGHSYSSAAATLPTIVAEQTVGMTYRGISTTTTQYQFKATTLESPNWRTMRFMGKRYVALALHGA